MLLNLTSKITRSCIATCVTILCCQVTVAKEHRYEKEDAFENTLILDDDQQSVSGTVTDADGQPLPGATVLEKGTTNGTQTDFDGNFTLSVSSNATLVVSYIGFVAQEVALNGRTSVNVQLLEDTSRLDEVVVVGYGTQKKANLTGAVSTVTSDVLDSRPITSAATALQGTASGVFINQNSGQAGREDVLIRIRGVGTLNNANPLVLVDGIEAPLNNINPQDIETVTVLKDAASAAIYGSRAANGVVLITTKRGKAGEAPQFTYDGFIGIQDAIRLPDMVTDPLEFALARNRGETNFGNDPFYSEESLAFIRDNADEIGTDWLDELFRSALIQQHTMSVSGGSEKTNYRFSLGYLNQDGTFERSNFKRVNARLNLDTQISDKFSVGTSIALSRGDRSSAFEELTGSSVIAAAQALPLFPVRDSQGRFGAINAGLGLSRVNPVALNSANDFTRISTDVLGNVYLQYKPIENLVLKATGGVNFQSDSDTSFGRQVSTFDHVTGNEFDIINDPRFSERFNEETLNTTIFLTANYTKSFGDHNLGVLIGYNQEESINEEFGARRNGHLNDVIRVIDVGDPSTATNEGTATEWALRSYFGRLNYDFNGKYLFEANVRVDGTSRFQDDKWGTFPSFSAGWVLSNEKFMEGVNAINFLKIRASWGQLGNQFAVDDNDFPFSRELSLEQAYNFGGQVVSGVAQTTFGNPALTWETTTTTDIGINLSIFNTISIEADYFIRTAEDILFNLPISVLSGFPEQITNSSTVENEGIELNLGYNETFGDFSVSLTGNVTYVNSEVTELNPGIGAGEVDRIIDGSRVTQQGSPINSFFGLRSIGIFQSQEEIDAAPDHSQLAPNFGPGDLRFEDVNGDGVVNLEDRVVLGQEDPVWTFGLNFNFGYKGIDLSGILQGAADFQSYGSAELSQPFFNGSGLWSGWLDAWTPENTNTTVPRIFNTNSPSTSAASSYFVLDRDYLRLRNLQIGYTFNDDINEKMGVKRLRLFANGSNLFTITDFPFFDPERPAGADRGASGFPNSRIITVGLSATF